MNLKIFFNDFKKNKLINSSIIIFIAISAMFVTFAFLMAFNLFGSIENLMEKAKTPDFLQMHSGEIDLESLESFSKNNKNVKDYQTLEYLNIEGDKIEINGISQDKAVQDLGIVYQSERFDFLLDLDNQVIDVDDGEIYLPLMYFKEGYVNIGDPVKIYDKTFSLKGFFRDSQMNSNLSGSKRILLSKKDFESFKDRGRLEYLIEFLLNDREKMTEFEKDYLDNIPEKNGPKVTYSMFKMINGLSDGLLIAIILLASFSILIISFLCIRFTLLSKIEDEYREIGVMKAIGIKSKEIKKQYLNQYLFMTLIGLLLGYLTALLFREKILENIHLYMGTSQFSSLVPLFSILGIILLFLIIITYINNVLKKINKITPVQAIRDGGSAYAKSTEKSLSIGNLGFSKVNLSLALSDLYARKNQYLTVLLVVLISTFLIVLPQNINNTFSHPSFVTYMGIGQIDLSLEIGEEMYSPEKEKTITEFIEEEKNISKFTLMKTNDIAVKLPKGESAYIRTSFGDHEAFPIKYSEGRGPEKENEIALTTLYLEDLDLKVGDSISLENGKKIEIVGEYSDISNGGKTAKAIFPTNFDKSKLTYYLLVKDKGALDEMTKRYNERFPEAKIASVKDYIDQSFGPLLGQINKVSVVLLIACLLVISLITMLFARLLIAKDKRQISILKSIGFNNNEISRQYIYRFLCLLVIALPLGIILANTLGSVFASAILSSFGVRSIKFVINPLTIYFLIPLSVIAVTIIFSKLSTYSIASFKLSDYIKE